MKMRNKEKLNTCRKIFSTPYNLNILLRSMKNFFGGGGLYPPPPPVTASF